MLSLQPGVCTGGRLFQGNYLPGTYLLQLYCAQLPSPSLVCTYKHKANTFAQAATSVSLLVINKLHAGIARAPQEGLSLQDTTCCVVLCICLVMFISTPVSL